MLLTYNILEDDFLMHQLYVASKSERTKKKRKINKLIPVGLFVLLSIGFYFNEKIVLAIYFAAMSFLWFILYPIWERRLYIKHYKGFIKENFKGRINELITIQFLEQTIITTNQGNRSEIQNTQIEKIIETPTLILLEITGTYFFIIPKNQLSDIEEVRVMLKSLANDLGIHYLDDKNWVWK